MPPNPFGEYFTGQSYLAILAQLNGVGIANVTFEPACRNNWHIHQGDNGGGQILLATGGRGWYQEWGKEAQRLCAGDVVTIPAGVKHWHDGTGRYGNRTYCEAHHNMAIYLSVPTAGGGLGRA